MDHGLGRGDAQALEGAPGRIRIPGQLPFGNVENSLRGEFPAVRRVPFVVHPPDGPAADAFLRDQRRIVDIPHQPDIAAAAVVPAQEPSVQDDAAAEAGSERDAQEVMVTLRASGRLQGGVQLRQDAREGLAIGEQVAVVVDENRESEDIFQVGAHRDAVLETREVGQVADDAVLVVRRPREGEADGDGRGVQQGLHPVEPFHQHLQAALHVVGDRVHPDGLHDFLAAADGGEHEVRAAGVEGQNSSLVVLVHKLKR